MANLLSHEELLLRLEIEDFLYMEADCLDEHRYEEWLDLLTEDVRYYAPMKRNVASNARDTELTRESHDISWFDEGKETLVKRVAQIRTGVHWAEEPLSPCFAFRNERAAVGLGLGGCRRRRDPRQVSFPRTQEPAGGRRQHLDRQQDRHAPPR